MSIGRSEGIAAGRYALSGATPIKLASALGCVPWSSSCREGHPALST